MNSFRCIGTYTRGVSQYRDVVASLEQLTRRMRAAFAYGHVLRDLNHRFGSTLPPSLSAEIQVDLDEMSTTAVDGTEKVCLHNEV